MEKTKEMPTKTFVGAMVMNQKETHKIKDGDYKLIPEIIKDNWEAIENGKLMVKFKSTLNKKELVFTRKTGECKIY